MNNWKKSQKINICRICRTHKYYLFLTFSYIFVVYYLYLDKLCLFIFSFALSVPGHRQRQIEGQTSPNSSGSFHRLRGRCGCGWERCPWAVSCPRRDSWRREKLSRPGTRDFLRVCCSRRDSCSRSPRSCTCRQFLRRTWIFVPGALHVNNFVNTEIKKTCFLFFIYILKNFKFLPWHLVRPHIDGSLMTSAINNNFCFSTQTWPLKVQK